MRYTGEGLFYFFPIFMKIFHFLYAVVSKTPKQGAQTTIYLALDDEIFNYNGYYFRYSNNIIHIKNFQLVLNIKNKF
jgi:hypothetical protein